MQNSYISYINHNRNEMNPVGFAADEVTCG